MIYDNTTTSDVMTHESLVHVTKSNHVACALHSLNFI